MIVSGRCHGPSCTQPAVVDFWCSVVCQARWHGQFEPPPVAGVATWKVSPGPFERDTMILALCHGEDRAQVEIPTDVLVDVPGPAVLLARWTQQAVDRGASLQEALSAAAGRLQSDAPLPASTGASSSQVASPFPQAASERGWLARWINRMFGRHP